MFDLTTIQLRNEQAIYSHRENRREQPVETVERMKRMAEFLQSKPIPTLNFMSMATANQCRVV